MDNKTAEILQKTFNIVSKFADDNNLFCECNVRDIGQIEGFMIYTDKNKDPVKSSVMRWNIDFKDKLTFSGVKTHIKLWQAFMFESWDGGTYNLESTTGKKKFVEFLETSLDSHKNHKKLELVASKINHQKKLTV